MVMNVAEKVRRVDIEEYVAILKSRGIFTDRKQVEKIFSLADV